MCTILRGSRCPPAWTVSYELWGDEEVEPMHFEGFPFKTYEEDLAMPNEQPEVAYKAPKDAKKKKK